MDVRSFISDFQQELPLSLALPDDPVGLQVGTATRELRSIGVAYEVTEALLETAAAEGVELIIAFHPLIYSPLRRLTTEGRVERCVIRLIESGTPLYVVHTAFDAHPAGTNTLLAQSLGLRNIRPLLPSPLRPDAGMGAVGELEAEIPLTELADLVKVACDTDCVRLAHDPARHDVALVKTVALVGGSGMSFYEDAVRAGADAFITADVRYHAFHAANDAIPILDPGHAESERFVTEGLASLVEKTLAARNLDLRVVRLRTGTNPVRYFVSQ